MNAISQNETQNDGLLFLIRDGKVYLTKLEIDITKADQIQPAMELAIKHHILGMTVPPEMVPLAIMARTVKQSNLKIITTVDAGRGLQYGQEKFRGMPVEAMSANAYEVLLTPGTQSQIIQEVKYLSDFFRSYFGQLIEMRFAIGMGLDGRTEEQMKHMLQACTKIAPPSLVRTCFNAKIAPNKIKETYEQQINFINSINDVLKVKVCGDVTPEIYRTVKAEKFAVTLAQLQNIVKQENLWNAPATPAKT